MTAYSLMVRVIRPGDMYFWHPGEKIDIDCDGDLDYYDSMDYITPIWGSSF